MKNKGLIKYAFAALFYFAAYKPCTKAQAVFKEDLSLVKRADELFVNECYFDAHPLYLKLVQKKPEDIQHYFRLTACTLFLVDDKEDVIKTFNSMVNNPEIEEEIDYFLGKAYMLNYKYADAIKKFVLYKQKGDPFNVRKFQVDRLIEMCINGQKNNISNSDWVFTSKEVVQRDTVLKSNSYKDVPGLMIKKPGNGFFNTIFDYAYEEELTTVYLAPDKSEMYTASYGTEEWEMKDLYRIKKLFNGIWEEAEKLPCVINSDYDENYPFLHPDGKTLYFSSKGHNSIGGYDIFKSTFNDITDLWSEPENLGTPINTPDDDILFITDPTGNYATYSSAQKISVDKLVVYKLVKTKKKPSE